MAFSGTSLPSHLPLQSRQAERDTLQQRIQQHVEQEKRLTAAWLFGSLGRREEDALSDIDIFLVVPDDQIEDMIANRYTFMAQFGELLLIQEAPQNAPPQGAYNMALYSGEHGPQQVDWYWQAQSVAHIPQQTIVLLDRVGLPHSDTPPQFDYQPVPKRTPLEAICQDVNFFWVMLLITAKYIARSPQEDRIELLKYVLSPFRQVEEFVGISQFSLSDTIRVPSSAEKLSLLRELTAQMEMLMPGVTAAGGKVPNKIVPQVRLYLDFIAGITADV